MTIFRPKLSGTLASGTGTHIDLRHPAVTPIAEDDDMTKEQFDELKETITDSLRPLEEKIQAVVEMVSGQVVRDQEAAADRIRGLEKRVADLTTTKASS